MTILIVEDEPLLRFEAADIIQDAGFTTLEAANADEAIKVLTTREDIRIVVTDINMPGSMDGLKLAATVRDRWPPIEIIVVSGQFLPTQQDLPERGRFLAKPYRARDLLSLVNQFAA